jgi:hypothetical protein
MVPDVLEHVTRVHRHHADDLGDIECRAAAEADDAVGVVRLEGGCAGHHLARGRVAEHTVEHCDIETIEVAAELRQHRQRGECLVSHDQRTLQALRAQVFGHQPACTGAEVDGSRKGETGDAHGNLA